MPKKLTYNYIKQYIEKRETECLSTKYKNAHDKLKLKCLKGHIYWMSYNNFKRGHRCPVCSGNKKLTYEYIKQYIEKRETECLSIEYKNSKTNLKLKCKDDHIYWMCWNYFQHGHRCPECYNKRRGSSRKLIYNQIKQYIESFKGYILLSKEYINAHIKLKIQCPKGHIFWMRWANFQQGQRCPECFNKKRGSSQKFENFFIIDNLKSYENIRENSDSEIEVTCKNCEEWFVPKRIQLLRKIYYIDDKTNCEYNIYCSEECKNICPIFGQNYYPKNNKLYLNREVQPQLRQLVFERDNYTCQKCEKHKDELNVPLHCHHIWPLNESPITSADIDECETLCKDCHKWIHINVPGCKYIEIKCNY